MERYSQFRDRGSGIAPYFPITVQTSPVPLPLRLLLFALRLPFLITVIIIYCLIFTWLPIGALGRKATLWSILLVSGVCWVDLQIDGVKRGSLWKQNKDRLPQPGTVIASSFTSPIDCLYLAAIFDPIFTASYPNTRLVKQLSLLQAVLSAFAPPQSRPVKEENLTDIATILYQNPDACVVILPECTTTNGRGILRFGPSLLSVPPKRMIFPISLRYTPGDITTPIPNGYWMFLWNLCSRPTHCIRVRIAEWMYIPRSDSIKQQSQPANFKGRGLKEHETIKNSAIVQSRNSQNLSESDALSDEETQILDGIAEALARLGRVKRVDLGVKEKEEFLRIWNKKRS